VQESDSPMNDNRLLVELIQHRVEQRMARYKRFGIHLIGGLAFFYLMILGASQGRISEGVAVGIALAVFLSLLLHGMWLGLQEVRTSITRQEIARLQQMYPDLGGLPLDIEKPKREGSPLVEDGDDESLDLDLLTDDEQHQRFN
jgi:uncharacterized membrane protein YfbV (UPF0208 family)